MWPPNVREIWPPPPPNPFALNTGCHPVSTVYSVGYRSVAVVFGIIKKHRGGHTRGPWTMFKSTLTLKTAMRRRWRPKFGPRENLCWPLAATHWTFRGRATFKHCSGGQGEDVCQVWGQSRVLPMSTLLTSSGDPVNFHRLDAISDIVQEVTKKRCAKFGVNRSDPGPRA
jgi:hypothetical protein